ncbi:26270_t:CDS:2, partial [Racocetra persica]
AIWFDRYQTPGSDWSIDQLAHVVLSYRVILTDCSIFNGFFFIKSNLQFFIAKLLETHNYDSNTEDNDFIHCDKATIYLLYQCLKDVFCVASDEIPMILLKATSLVDYAVEKLHAYPYKDVPISWRGLYTDASLLKSVCEIFLVPNVEDKNSWKQVIKTLDMAFVMTGAPGNGRKEMLFNLIEETEKILRKLEQINYQQSIQFTSPKRTMDDNYIKNTAHKKSKTQNSVIR